MWEIKRHGMTDVFVLFCLSFVLDTAWIVNHWVNKSIPVNNSIHIVTVSRLQIQFKKYNIFFHFFLFVFSLFLMLIFTTEQIKSHRSCNEASSNEQLVYAQAVDCSEPSPHETDRFIILRLQIPSEMVSLLKANSFNLKKKKILTPVSSQWDFSHGKSRLPSLGKTNCNRVALPILCSMLGIFSVSAMH